MAQYSPIYQWRGGKLIATYSTLNDAAQAIAKTRPNAGNKGIRGNISSASHGRIATAYGYQWTTTSKPPKPLQQPQKSGYTTIYQWKDGELVATYDTVRDAAQAIAKTRPNTKIQTARSNISTAARGKYSAAYGYQWTITDKPPKQLMRWRRPRYTTIYQWKDGELVATYNTAREATQAVTKAQSASDANRLRGNIQSALAGRTATAYGYQWTITDKPPKPLQQQRKVKYTTIYQWKDGELVATYDTVRDAAQAIAKTRPNTKIQTARSNISAAISGKSITIYGYQWTTTSKPPKPQRGNA